jgi:DNA-binding transcriptional regulator LsrR (DeoR family)
MGTMRIKSDDLRKWIVSLYQSGEHTQQMIAEIVVTSQSNVSKILAKARNEGAILPTRNVAGDREKRTPMFSASQVGPAGSALNLDYL